jgi:two-component system, cell cycle response regulator
LAVFAHQASVAVHNAKLYELAAIDQLTRVYTRTFTEHAVLRELRVAQRSLAPLAVLVADLDDLKLLNDEGGHLCGDTALAAVAKQLKSVTRLTDIVGRIGGDEFMVVLPGCDAAGAAIVMDRLQRACLGLEVADARGKKRPVRVSVGAVALPVPEADQHHLRSQPQGYFESLAKSLVAEADAALYAAKRSGKARGELGRKMAWQSRAPADAVDTPQGAAPLLDAVVP